MNELRAWGLSEVGVTRTHNEDYFEIDPRRRLYLVADGMGGHSHGEVASRTAVQAVRDYLEDRLTPDESSGGPTSTEAQALLLRSAIHTAHEKVLRAIRQDGALTGMGTTLVALLVCGESVAVAHVGDSRAYRLRQERLDLLTEDHTWVHEQVMAGFLSEEQARVHPLKNVVTRALGSEGDIQVDVRELPVEAGDRFLLCSDGLTTMMRDAEIAETLASGSSLQEVCRELVQGAKARGGFDDVTVVVVEVEPEP